MVYQFQYLIGFISSSIYYGISTPVFNMISSPISQLRSVGGITTFYIARSTYPSQSYYEQMITSRPDKSGIMFIPQPEGTIDIEGIIYCNIKGDNHTRTNVSIDCGTGGKNGFFINLQVTREAI